jgi:hypothetical protein
MSKTFYKKTLKNTFFIVKRQQTTTNVAETWQKLADFSIDNQLVTEICVRSVAETWQKLS